MVFLSFFALGWFANELYNYKENPRKIDGLWLQNVNETRVEDISMDRDGKGDWVCVNVRGMEYSRAVEVCNHEVGHEIFAEICEKNITKCLEVGK